MRLKPIPADAKTRVHLSLNKGHFIRRLAASTVVCRRDEIDDSGFRLVGDIIHGTRTGPLRALSDDWQGKIVAL